MFLVLGLLLGCVASVAVAGEMPFEPNNNLKDTETIRMLKKVMFVHPESVQYCNNNSQFSDQQKCDTQLFKMCLSEMLENQTVLSVLREELVPHARSLDIQNLSERVKLYALIEEKIYSESKKTDSCDMNETDPIRRYSGVIDQVWNNSPYGRIHPVGRGHGVNKKEFKA